jgi:hypothetical protein
MWLGTTRWLLAVSVTLSVGAATAGEPPVGLSDDGTVIVYRAQPGDMPGAIAERFGIGAADLPAFLAANGISDATRVAAGHVYRIPNPLAARATAAEARAAALTAEADAARIEARSLAADVARLTARAEELEQSSAHLARLARLWPWIELLGLVLVAALAVTGYAAHQSAAHARAAERYAGGLADQLDERRRGALAERQASARRILNLEEQVRALERELTPLRPVHRRPTGTH